MKPQIKAIYITVKDMNRAVRFYEDIFDTNQTISIELRIKIQININQK